MVYIMKMEQTKMEVDLSVKKMDVLVGLIVI